MRLLLRPCTVDRSDAQRANNAPMCSPRSVAADPQHLVTILLWTGAARLQMMLGVASHYVANGARFKNGLVKIAKL